MKIGAQYSHLNGLEYLLVHAKPIWDEITAVIEAVDAESCRTKVSEEEGMLGELLYGPKELNKAMSVLLKERGWQEERFSYYVTDDAQLIRKSLSLEAKEQKSLIEAAHKTPIFTYNQTDFTKNRVAVEVQFGKYSFVAYDLFVKHMSFYVGDKIDVGVEILPMKEFQQQMSSGPGYYENELTNLIRQGRGVPAVPLVLIGVTTDDLPEHTPKQRAAAKMKAEPNRAAKPAQAKKKR